MSITDPWATAETEPAAVEASAAPVVGHVDVAVRPKLEALVDSGKLVTTFKAGSSYDSPWVVVHANSVEESNEILNTAFAEYLTKVKKVAQFFNGGTTAPAQGSCTPARSNVPQGATEAPSWAAPKPHDDFVYKTGVSAKNGKTWHAWMPPTKDDQRAAKFFYPPN